MSQAMATVILWHPTDSRSYHIRAVAELPVMQALRMARNICDRNPAESTWELRGYARTVSCDVVLCSLAEYKRTPNYGTLRAEHLLMAFDADIRYVPSCADMGWAP